MEAEMLLMDLAKEIRRDEGVKVFDIYQDYYEHQNYQIYAVFKTQEAMDAFEEHPLTQEWDKLKKTEGAFTNMKTGRLPVKELGDLKGTKAQILWNAKKAATEARSKAVNSESVLEAGRSYTLQGSGSSALPHNDTSDENEQLRAGSEVIEEEKANQ